MSDVTGEVVSVTPEMAAEWLGNNGGNRNLRPVYVKQLAAMMKAGKWKVAQPILFSTRGALVDGQHRLSAVVGSGSTVQMLVVRGVKPSAFDVIDQGRNRSAGDLHQAMGGTNSSKACSIAVNLMLGVSQCAGIGGGAGGKASRTSRADVAKYALKHNTEIQRMVEFQRAFKLGNAPVCAAIIRGAEIAGWPAAEEWMRQLVERDFEGKDDPMNQLMGWLINNVGKERRGTASQPRHRVYGAALAAVRAAIDGASIKQIKPMTAELGR